MGVRGTSCLVGAVVACLCLTSLPVHAVDLSGSRFGIGVETGTVRFSRNDVRIPGDTGTRFDMTELIGTDAVPFVRLHGRWRFGNRQELRVVLAPLSVTGTGPLARDTAFDGTTFAAGETEGTYQFNAYKLTYRYSFPERGRWRWGVGFTGVVRDAKIELRQGDRVARNTNVGFVPTLHLSGDYRLSDRWTFGLDVDALAGGPGRLIDLGAKLDYALGERWQVGAGYRTLEGGADTDEVFNFSWLNYAVLDVRYRF